MALTDGQVAGIGAGISGLTGIGGLISGLIGSKRNLKAVRETNEMNFRIAQMNNDYNKEMMERQMAYNIDMWNRANEYNTAANQRKRLEEAGLNPYLMMNGGDAGSASSVGGINPPSAQQVTMQPEVNSLGQVGAALMSMANPMMAYAQIRKTFAEARSAGAAADVGQATVGTDISLRNAELMMTKATTSQVILHNLRTYNDLMWLPAEKMASLANLVADTNVKIFNGVLTRREADHELLRQVETWCRINGIASDNRIKAVQARVAEATEEYQKMQLEYQAKSTKQGYGTIDSPWQILTQPDKILETIRAWKRVYPDIVNELTPSGQRGKSPESLSAELLGKDIPYSSKIMFLSFLLNFANNMNK